MDERQPIAGRVASELAAAEPRVLLLDLRVLRRVIRLDSGLSTAGVNTPHDLGWRIRRDRLATFADRDELGESVHQAGDGSTVAFLMPRVQPRQVREGLEGAVFLDAWRALFHLTVDEALDAALASGALDDAAVAERIDRIGQTPFDEVRAVLRHEQRLLPGDDDRAAYREFAALYFELRFFSPDQIRRYFPTLDDPDAVEALLHRDVAAAEIFTATRLRSAPDPIEWLGAHSLHDDVPDAPVQSDTEPLEELRLDAADAAAIGNFARAALSYRRVATRSEEATARAEADDRARAAVSSLVASLAQTLSLRDAPAQRWNQALWPLVCHAATPGMTPAARVLLDIQNVALDDAAHAERAPYQLDVYGWVTSLGRQPLKRALPTDRLARRVRTLRRARRRLPRIRLTDPQQAALALLLQSAQDRAEELLRGVLTAELNGALDEIGLTPQTTTGSVARTKLVAELCDQVVEGGLIHIGHLRDALSRNDMKLDNLGGPGKFLRGDELLQLNKRLGQRLGGVYRRGEVYMRFLQRISSLLFGTSPGQLFTRYVALPFGGAFVLIEGFDHVIMPLVKLGVATDFRLMSLVTWLVASLVLFGTLHVALVRRVLGRTLEAIGAGIRHLTMELPAAVWRWPPIQRGWRSRPMVLLRRFVIKPALLGGVLWIALPLVGAASRTNVIAAAVLFVLANLVLNSRYGRRTEEAIKDAVARSWHRVRHRILPGMLRWTMEVFRLGLELLERALYRVGEFLRFRKGDAPVTVAVKSVSALIWGALTYVIRFYVNLLIEPQVNPIKHFPVVTVAHKLMIPALPELGRMMLATTEPVMGTVMGALFTGTTIFLLPGVAGFLVWEFKENWKLYRANRPASIEPSIIGHHSETMARLMRPGFHSGTLPKLYSKLRQSRRSYRPKGALRARHGLVEVQHAVRRFIDRELLALLQATTTWGDLPVRTGEIRLGSNMVRVELQAPSLTDWRSVVLAFEEQSGWLVSGVGRRGWLDALRPAQRKVFGLALTGLYKRAGVDIVREQIVETLGDVQAYDVADDGLVVWPGPGYAHRELRPLDRANAAELLLSTRRLPWDRWETLLEAERGGESPPPEVLGAVLSAARG